MTIARNNSEPGAWDIATGIGTTALAAAAGRAVETSRPDALIRDPYAAAFVRAAGASGRLPVDDRELAAAHPQVARSFGGTIVHLAVRTTFFDAACTDAAAAGIGQVVILAAGLDTRAYRLEGTADSALYEIDQPAVLAFKQEVLDAAGAAPRRPRHAVPADLRDDWPAALLAAGFDPTRRSVWLAEGLLLYLPAAVQESLVSAVERLTVPGSRFAVEHTPADVLDALAGDRTNQEVGIRMSMDMRPLWNREPRPDLETRLRAGGWRVGSESAGAVAARQGRPLDPAVVGRMADARLVTAVRA